MAVIRPKTLSWDKDGTTYRLRGITSSEETKIANALTEHQDISGKVDKVTGKGLSTNDYTTAEKNKLAGIAAGATANTGTITGIKMNGASKGTSGVVDLGTVITAHQDISGKLNTSLKGAANGLAELDANGKVPSSQLPSYVDDVLEYAGIANFPATGETGKIYVDTTTNKTYRWSGTAYVNIASNLALGETSSTAYRGDRGKTAYNHASAKGSAFSSGLYKITTNAQGHVTAAAAVQKSDITGLGIPGSDTTYSAATQSVDGLMSSTDKTKLDGIATGANNYTHPSHTAKSSGLYKVTVDNQGHVSAATAVQKSDITGLGIPGSDTDTKVTSAANHYVPSTDSESDVTASATGATAAWSIDVVKGVTLNTDGKGHVTGMSVESGKIPANPNTDTKVRQTLKSDNVNRPLLMSYSTQGTTTGNVDNVSYRANNIYANASTGTITATNFSGKNNGFTLGMDVPAGSKLTDTTYSAATQSADGLMSSTDKTKLDGIATGANNYTHPSHTAKSSGLYKVTVDNQGHVSAATAVQKSDITGLGIPGSDTTYSAFTGASSSTNGSTGLVPAPSSGDKEKYLKGDGTWGTPESASPSAMVDLIYPVGSIYMSVASTSPATLFGGTWDRLKGRFLLGAEDAGDTTDDPYIGEATGGAASQSYTPVGSVGGHTLTTEEIPSHSHGLANHTHGYSCANSPTGGPSTDSSGGCTLSATQIPAHQHYVSAGRAEAGASNYGIVQQTVYNASGTTGGMNASGGGSHSHTLSSHTHGLGYSWVASGGVTGNTDASGSGGSHSHGFTGTAATISTLPPFLAVYMWKRTA